MEQRPNGVSTRDHLESIIVRLEGSLKEQIAELRDDIKHMQANYVTRAEHKLIVDFLREELERVEQDGKSALKSHVDQGERSTAKIIAVASLVAGIIMTAVQVGVSFLT